MKHGHYKRIVCMILAGAITFLRAMGSMIDADANAIGASDDTSPTNACTHIQATVDSAAFTRASNATLIMEEGVTGEDAAPLALGFWAVVGTNSWAAAQPTSSGRTLGALQGWDGKLYSGYGDYDANTGPIRLMAFDPETATFTNEFTFDTEAIYVFRPIFGRLYVPPIDPKSHSGIAVCKPSTGWAFQSVWMEHGYDITTLTGGDLWLVGSYGDDLSQAMRSVDDGVTWQTGRRDVFPNDAYSRFYFAATLNGKLYLQSSSTNVCSVFDGTTWTYGVNISNYGSLAREFGDNIVLLSRHITPNDVGNLLSFNGTQSPTVVQPSIYNYTVNGNTLYTIGSDRVVRSTTTTLKNWQTVCTAPPGSRSIAVLNNRLYVGTTSSDIYVYSVPVGTLPAVRVLPTQDLADECNSVPGTFTIKRASIGSTTLTVNFSFTGTAIGGGVDYTATPTSTVTIPAGTDSATVSIVPVKDHLVEGSEFVNLVLTPDAAYSIETPSDARVMIADARMITLDPVSLVMSESEGIATITVRLSSPLGVPVTVPFSIGGSALPGSDYTLSPSPVVIAAGSTNAILSIAIIDDPLPEEDETVIITLGTPTHAILGASDTVCVLTIQNDDWLPVIADVTAMNITTTSAQLMGNVVSTGVSATAVTAYWGTSDGGTNAGGWAQSTVLNAPQPIGYASVDVSGLPPNQTIYYQFSASNEERVVWASSSAHFITGEIALTLESNADETTLTPGAFTVSRPGTTTNEPLIVTYAQTGGTAIPGVDFAALSGSETIPAGAMTAHIFVTPWKNYAVKTDTTLQLTLTGAAAIIGSASNAALTIVNEVLLDNVFVSKTGDNSNGKTWATARHNLQAALNEVAANGTIHVAGGQTFELAATVLWPAFNNITLRGGYEALTGTEPGANNSLQWPTVIKTLNGVNVRLLTLSSVSGATLENLTLRDGHERTSLYGGAVYANGVNGLAIRNCRFAHNDVVGANGYGGGLAAINCSGLITNCVFLGNFAATTTGHGTGSRGGAFYLSGGNWTLRDLQVHGNWTAANSGGSRSSGFDMAGGIYLGGAGASFQAKNLLIVNCDGGGLRVDSGAATLENLTVSGCDLTGISITSGAAAGSTIRNSIIFGNRDDLAGTPPKLRYNIIGDGTSAGTHGNLTADPLFTFPLYYLADGSPALDSGTGTVATAGLAGTTVRVDGTADSGTVSRGYHFPAGVVWDRDLFVAPGGNGDGYSPTSPLRSVTDALTAAAPRTRIHLAAGTYNKSVETFPLAFNGRTIQLLGTNAAATVIDASGSGKRVIEVIDTPFGDNKLSGITLCGGYYSGNGSLPVENATLTIDQSIIRDNSSSAGSGHRGGGVHAMDTTLLIQHSSFLRNTAQNSTGHIPSYGGGLAAYSAVTMRLLNTVFRENKVNPSATPSLYNGGGIWLGRGFYQLRNLLLVNNIGGGAYVSASAAVGSNASPGISTLENITAYGNNAVGIHVDASAAPTCTLRNTIAYGNGVTNFSGTLPQVFEHNCVGGGTQAGLNGNITADPLFVDAVHGDFQLADESPCFNAGLNLDWMTTATDLAGNPRVRSGRVDMGAYEIEPPFGTILIIR